MENKDVEKEKGNKESRWYKFIQGWIWLIMALTICMFIIVTIDRCTFHNAVYKKAKTEIIKEIAKGIPVDSLRYSKDSSVVTICISDASEIPDNNFEKQLVFLEKSDNLLSSNSLTYLVTLIVALLAALLIFRVEADETSKEKIRKLRKEALGLKDELSKLTKEKDRIIEEAQDSKVELSKLTKEAQNLKKETDSIIKQLTTTGDNLSSYYNHIKKYDGYLTNVESIYVLTIMISNTTATLSPSKSDEENESIATEVGGSLCSRLALIYDNYIKYSKIDYLTTDEKDILSTYLDDAQSALKSTLKRIKRSVNHINKDEETQKNYIDYLTNYIVKNIESIENIKKMINDVEIRKEDNV